MACMQNITFVKKNVACGIDTMDLLCIRYALEWKMTHTITENGNQNTRVTAKHHSTVSIGEKRALNRK